MRNRTPAQVPGKTINCGPSRFSKNDKKVRHTKDTIQKAAGQQVIYTGIVAVTNHLIVLIWIRV